MRQSRKLFSGYPPLRGFESLPLRHELVKRGPGYFIRRAGIAVFSGGLLPDCCRRFPISVQRVLGHARMSTILDVYASAADSNAAEAMSKR